MTIASQTSRISYNGDGVTTSFAVPFYFQNNSDLVIYLQDALGNQTLQVLGTNYNLSGATVSTGGTCTFILAPPTGVLITIYRDPPLTQTTSYNNNDPFPAKSHELALDKALTIDQRTRDLSARSIRLSDAESALTVTQLAAIATRKNKLLGFDSTGALIYVTGPTFVGSTFVGVAEVDSRATAQTTVFAISVNVVRTNGLTTPGDGGALNYVRGLVTDTGAFQDAGGVYWKPFFAVATANLFDKSVTLAKLYHPSGPSLLLGTDSNAALTITGAANNGSGLIRLQVASTATFATSQIKTVSDVLGTIEANGTWTITVVDATHIDLQGSTFAHTYTSGGTIGGGVEEITLGQYLSLSGSVLNATPPLALAGAQGLVINNNVGTPNTIIDIAADQAIMNAPAKSIYATAVAVSINTSVTGANGLDTGARAVSTCYNLFLISNGTITAGLASLSATAPTMPGGYTFAVRVGAMFTDGSGNFYRFIQRGNRAKYVVTPATNTAAPRPIINQSGAIGNSSTGVYVASSLTGFIPPTATQLHLQLMSVSSAASMTVLVAPNNNYGAYSSNTNMPPITTVTDTTSNQALNQGILATLLLETQQIYVASSGGANLVIAAEGWTDKVNAT